MSDNLNQVIARVREYQEWRRGEGKYNWGIGDGDNPPVIFEISPKQIGQDIDALLAIAEKSLRHDSPAKRKKRGDSNNAIRGSLKGKAKK